MQPMRAHVQPRCKRFNFVGLWNRATREPFMRTLTGIPVYVIQGVGCRQLESRAKSVAPFTSVELRLSANFNLSANSAFAWSDGIAKILLCPSADAFIQMIDIYRISFTMIPIRSMSGLFSTCSKNEHG